MSKPYELPSLNGFRALSIMLVLVAHLAASNTLPMGWAPALSIFNGALGVRIFFCISGFLITHLLLREKYSNDGGILLGKFYLRRALRILPVSYFYILVLVALSLLTSLKYTPCEFVSAATYTKNYFCSQSVDGHLWSLAVEEQFYLIWPFVVALAPKRIGIGVALALIAISPLSRAVEYIAFGHRAFFWLTSHTDALMLGALGAYFVQFTPERLERALAWNSLPGRALALLAIIVPEYLNQHLLLGRYNVTLGQTLQAAGAVYLILSYTLGPGRGAVYAFLNLRPVVYVGLLSYSLYIWQELFLLSYPAGSLIMRFPQNLILTFAAAFASYHALEMPFLKLRSRLRGAAKVAA